MKKLSRKQKWIIFLSLSVVVFLALGAIATSKLDKDAVTPTGLGPRVEYAGKVNTTCEWWQVPLFLGFCKGPQYDYFFTTDMSKEELVGYFRGAKFDNPDSQSYGEKYMDFYLQRDSERFTVIYYANYEALPKPYQSAIEVTDKHIISLSEYGYMLAQKAL